MLLRRRVAARLVSLRWPPAAAIATAGLAGMLLPAIWGSVFGIADPIIHDEFSYLLGADTFAEGRITNPAPALPEFFEAPHVLVTPTYQSKYPPGQAALLALGQVLFGHPIWGVWIGCGLFAAALCWMLQAWVPRAWAFTVTMLAVLTLGTGTYWAQSYWGGMAAATGGALVFGGMRRTLRRITLPTSLAFGSGTVVLMHTRPFEGLLVLLPAGVVLAGWLFRHSSVPIQLKFTRFVMPAGLVVGLGLIAMGTYNDAVTGHPLDAPYSLHQRQYFHQGVLLFSGQHSPTASPVSRVGEFYAGYVREPLSGAPLAGELIGNLASRLILLMGTPFGFLAAPRPTMDPYLGITLWMLVLLRCVTSLKPGVFTPLAAALVLAEGILWLFVPGYPWWLAPFVLVFWGAAVALHRRRNRWSGFFAGTIIFGIAGQALVLWWYPHYAAPLIPLLFAALAITLWQAARRAPLRVSPGIALGKLAALHLLILMTLSGVIYARSGWNDQVGFHTHGQIVRHLTGLGGSHLVFVEYEPEYSLHREWVYNRANLHEAAVIFAHNLGLRNDALVAMHPERSVWGLRVTTTGASLTRLGH